MHWVHGNLCEVESDGSGCTCWLSKQPESITIATDNTSDEAFAKAIDLYNQKQWYEL